MWNIRGLGAVRGAEWRTGVKKAVEIFGWKV